LKLLVTGGAGYVGSVVANLLVEVGHETVVLDNLSSGHERAVPEGARFVKGDLLDACRLRAEYLRGLAGNLRLAMYQVGLAFHDGRLNSRSDECGGSLTYHCG